MNARAHRWTRIALLFVGVGCATSTGSGGGAIDVPASLRDAMVTPEMGSPHAGDAAPPFDLPRVGGGRVRLEELRGKPVLLHFTATWCPYCREEIAAIAAIARDVADRAAVVLVDVQESEARWREFGAVEDNDAALIVLLDEDGAVSARYAPPRARPFLERAEVPLAGTVLIDAEGVVRLYVLADNAQFDPTLAAVREVFASMARAAKSLVPAAAAAPVPPPAANESAALPEIELSARSLQLVAGGEAILEVIAVVPPGVHIMTNAPPDPALVPTALDIVCADVDAQPVRWPAAVPYRVVDRELPTFQGDVVLRVPLRAAAGVAPGARPLTGKLRYQACTSTRCFMPRTAAFTAVVDVIR